MQPFWFQWLPPGPSVCFNEGFSDRVIIEELYVVLLGYLVVTVLHFALLMLEEAQVLPAQWASTPCVGC